MFKIKSVYKIAPYANIKSRISIGLCQSGLRFHVKMFENLFKIMVTSLVVYIFLLGSVKVAQFQHCCSNFLLKYYPTELKINNNVKGFICDGKELKVSMYAYDANAVLSDIDSIAHVLNIIHNFSNTAGPILNMSKTKYTLLGPLKLLNVTHIAGIKIESEPIKCLGLYFGI